MGPYEIYSEEELIATFLQSEMEVTPLWSSRLTPFELARIEKLVPSYPESHVVFK